MVQWRSPGQQDASACFSIRTVSTEQVETSETQFTGQTKIKNKSEQQDCTLCLQSKIALFLWHLITPCREDCLVFQSDALNFTRQYFTVQIYPCVVLLRQSWRPFSTTQITHSPVTSTQTRESKVKIISSHLSHRKKP